MWNLKLQIEITSFLLSKIFKWLHSILSKGVSFILNNVLLSDVDFSTVSKRTINNNN